MALTEDGRDAIKKSNRDRGQTCGGCGAFGTLEIVDGSKIGGMPGIQYKHCGGCNWSRAIVKKPARFKL